ncbi:MAG TPA: hypothetical protein VF846_00345 [Thermoanaerobaculia bacterium]
MSERLMRRLILLLLLSLSSVARAEHLLCLASDGVITPPNGCVKQVRVAPVETARVDRKYALIKKSADSIVLGVLPANEADVDAYIKPMFAITLDLPGDSDGTVTMTEATLGTWKLTLDAWWFKEGRLNVSVPEGDWHYVVTRDGKIVAQLKKRVRSMYAPGEEPDRPRAARGVASKAAPGRVVLTGRAVSADGSTPADFAEITADCKRVVCSANADGSFKCNTPLPAEESFCVEHPRVGRKRIELAGAAGMSISESCSSLRAQLCASSSRCTSSCRRKRPFRCFRKARRLANRRLSTAENSSSSKD